MQIKELYKLHNITKGILCGEIENITEIVPLLQDIKSNEPLLYDKLLKLLGEYRHVLAERIVDSTQRILKFDKD